jgi:hypothetical protein
MVTVEFEWILPSLAPQGKDLKALVSGLELISDSISLELSSSTSPLSQSEDCSADDLSWLLPALLLRGALSFRPKGRPVFTTFLGRRFVSKGRVSSCQVRPHHMSRIVFSLTLKSLATETADGLILPGDDALESLNMSITCSLVRTARGFTQADEGGDAARAAVCMWT